MPYSQKQWQDRIKDAQGNIIQEGTPFSAGNMNRMEQGIADAHAQLEEAARQKQTLIHGVSLLNGGVDAPVNIEIEGRTLIPMQNTVLDPLKYYVLADKKTKLKWADATIQSGILKFTGKAERPILIRVTNFEGKVAGSTLENPHINHSSGVTTLGAPSTFNNEADTTRYGSLSKLDGTLRSTSVTGVGNIAQQLFSFNLIEEVERQLGRIPRATVADKVQWLKDNIAKISGNWHGFGSYPGGNKATFAIWRLDNSFWEVAGSPLSGTVTKVAAASTAANLRVDANGFVHFLAYAEPTDGSATPSAISTDYIEMEVELKPEAILHAPRVPLYEVTKEHYDAINVTMLEDEVLRRYPSVEGVTHLQNPYIMAEGENLVPPFYEWSDLGRGAVINGAYEVTNKHNGVGAILECYVPVISGQPYTVTGVPSHNSATSGLRILVYPQDANRVQIGTTFSIISETPTTITTDAATKYLRFVIYAYSLVDATVKNIAMTPGATAKPFTPRNPSYALFETKLGKIGDAADRLYEQDAKYFKRKVIEDVVLDGSLIWALADDSAGYKRFAIGSYVTDKGMIPNSDKVTGTKFNGLSLKPVNYASQNNFDQIGTANTGLHITVSDLDTGFAETFSPTSDESRAYFNGWKYTGTADRVTQTWVSVVDGSAAPTQTVDYVKVNKAANYTPYKMSYVLAAPKTEEIRSEGAISVNGLIQIEVGSGVIVREKVTPKLYTSDSRYYLNYGDAVPSITNKLSKMAVKIIDIYKNALEDTGVWTLSAGSPSYYGGAGARIEQAAFDTTAEYYVTYLVLDRKPFTSNPVNVSAQFASNVRSSLEDTVKKVEDNQTAISVNALILLDVLKRLKAGGL